jgi:hypothetical protein
MTAERNSEKLAKKEKSVSLPPLVWANSSPQEAERRKKEEELRRLKNLKRKEVRNQLSIALSLTPLCSLTHHPDRRPPPRDREGCGQRLQKLFQYIRAVGRRLGSGEI